MDQEKEKGKMKEKKEKEELQQEDQEVENDNEQNKNLEEEDSFDNNTETSPENNEDDNIDSQIEILKEEKIRLLAEMENLRKRFDREKVDTIKFGSINLARDILSPADNLERALSALPEKDDYSENIKNLVEGLKMVLKEFKSILEKHGVKKIETINQKFDHNFHQAMMEVERDDLDEGIVVQEVQSGYTMHDRLLRAAMVGVSKNKAEKDEDKISSDGINDSNKEKGEEE